MADKKIGLLEATSIGIGGMIGGGIFAVLGLTVLLARGAAPLAFLVAGLIALVTSYSYAKLAVRFPSEGGTIEFILRAFGPGLIPAWLNILLLASYIIMLSLYAYAFGSYGAVLLKGTEDPLLKKALIIIVVSTFTFLNLLGALIVGRAEDIMVVIKVLILLFFSALGFMNIDPNRLMPSEYPPPLHILTGGLIIFLAYEGFELIANTATEIRDPDQNLPRAFYAAVLFVIFIYALVALVAVGNLPFDEVVRAKDYVLAEAARPFLGQAGFVLIGIAAVLSTASAINATLYGTARISYLVAKYGELPRIFSRRIWKGAYEGLIILAVLTIMAALSFDLENISVAGSLGFLVVFAMVNFANLKLAKVTSASRIPAAIGGIGCLLSAVVLVVHTLKTNPSSLKSATILIGATFLFEMVFRTRRRFSEFVDWRLREKEAFLDRYEDHLKTILEAIGSHFREAEVYLLDELARGEREGANKLHLAVVLPRKLSPEEKRRGERKIRTSAGLKSHHPLKITFLHPQEKEWLAPHSAKKIREVNRPLGADSP
ncbi:hypothetical protein HNQ76_000400 [Thermosulfuriphilus ammonigenes]|nr:APC family permease [Thermosulfuriphilus ammonigenes]MBA2848054.1 hypothetical protein [Thermosulfuriphilus ammonigenes]